MTAQVLTVSAPRASAREAIPVASLDLPTVRDIVRRLQDRVGREMDGMTVTDKIIYITYEEVAACPPPPTENTTA